MSRKNKIITTLSIMAITLGLSTIDSNAGKMQYVEYKEPKLGMDMYEFSHNAANNLGIKNMNQFKKVNLETVYTHKFKTIKNNGNEGTYMIHDTPEARKIINNKKYGDKDLPNFFGVKLSENPTMDEMMELPIKLEMVEDWWKYQNKNQCKSGVVMRMWIGDTYVGRVKIKRENHNGNSADIEVEIISVANSKRLDMKKHKDAIWALLTRGVIYNLEDSDFTLPKHKYLRNIIQMNYNSFNGGICLSNATIEDGYGKNSAYSIVYGHYTPGVNYSINYNEAYSLIKKYPEQVKRHLKQDVEYQNVKLNRAGIIADQLCKIYPNIKQCHNYIHDHVERGREFDENDHTDEVLVMMDDAKYMNDNFSKYIEDTMALKDFELPSGHKIGAKYDSIYSIALLQERYHIIEGNK